MSKHTKGPWLAVKYSAKKFGLGCPGDGAWMMLQTVYPDADDPEMRANARLIAASPDLYAVLKELQESAAYWSEYDVPIGIVDRINQAIAKAEGTT